MALQVKEKKEFRDLSSFVLTWLGCIHIQLHLNTKYCSHCLIYTYSQSFFYVCIYSGKTNCKIHTYLFQKCEYLFNVSNCYANIIHHKWEIYLITKVPGFFCTLFSVIGSLYSLAFIWRFLRVFYGSWLPLIFCSKNLPKMTINKS